MSEDFIIDEEDSEEGAANRRPFLIAASVLVVLLLISGICAGVSLLGGNGNGTDDAQATLIAQRLLENEQIAVTNTAVAITVEALTAQAMTAAAVTPTSPPTATSTPAPTLTPIPTETPVVQAAEDETPDPEILGTTEFETGGGDSTPTPIAVAGGDAGGGGSDTLPETGINTWSALLAAFAFIAILFAARRLRSS